MLQELNFLQAYHVSLAGNTSSEKQVLMQLMAALHALNPARFPLPELPTAPRRGTFVGWLAPGPARSRAALVIDNADSMTSARDLPEVLSVCGVPRTSL